MATCWEVLGLEKEGADEKAVKRAYARALKKNRPDRDPEGFQKVREAYESVMSALTLQNEDAVMVEVERGRRDAGEATLDGPAERSEVLSGHSSVAANRSSEFRSAREHLEALLRSEDPGDDEIRGAMKAFHEAAMEDQPGGLAAWGDELWRLGGEESWAGIIAGHLANDQLIRELENDANSATRLALDAWSEKAEYKRLVSLAKAIIKQKDRLRNPVAAGAMAHLAGLLGIIDRFRAELLLDLAYPLLPPNSREFLAAGAEEWIAYGRLFHALPTPQAAFWDQRFRRRWSGEEFDWNSAPARAAVEDLTTSGRVTQPMLDVLQGVLPEKLSIEVRREVQWEAPAPQPGPRAAPDPSHAGRFIWMALVILFVFSWLLRSINDDDAPRFSTNFGELSGIDSQSYNVENLMKDLIVTDPAVQSMIDQVKTVGIMESLSLIREGGELDRGSPAHRQALFHLVRDQNLPGNDRALLPKIFVETFGINALQLFDLSLAGLELPVLLAMEAELDPYPLDTLTLGNGDEVTLGFDALAVFKERLKARIRLLSPRIDLEPSEMVP